MSGTVTRPPYPAIGGEVTLSIRGFITVGMVTRILASAHCVVANFVDRYDTAQSAEFLWMPDPAAVSADVRGGYPRSYAFPISAIEAAS